jgi:hypothetical protein
MLAIVRSLRLDGTVPVGFQRRANAPAGVDTNKITPACYRLWPFRCMGKLGKLRLFSANFLFISLAFIKSNASYYYHDFFFFFFFFFFN